MQGSPRIVKKEKIITFPNNVYLLDCHSFLFSPFLLKQRFSEWSMKETLKKEGRILRNVCLKGKEKKEKNDSLIKTPYLVMW